MTKHRLETERKNQIIKAAAYLFSIYGYEKTSVDQIAKRARVSKGTIYWYFRSKLDILFTITDQEIQTKQQQIIQITWNKYGPEAFWKIHKEVCNSLENQSEKNSIQRQLVDLSRRYPEIKKKLLQYYKSWDQLAVKLLKWANQQGYFKKANYKAISRVLSAMYDGLYMRKQLEPDIDIANIITYATKLMYQALITSSHLNAKKRLKPKRNK